MLWTDLIDPATLTGYARKSLSEYEAAKGSLSQFLPNQTVADTAIRAVVGSSGLVEEARFRAFDAEPEMLRNKGVRRVTVDLPALSGTIPVSEYEQLRTRRASDAAVLDSILKTTDTIVKAVADRMERMRGTVLVTGKATYDQSNYNVSEDFGRAPALTVTAPTLWSDPAADPAGYIETLQDLYTQTNGVGAGILLMSRRVFRAIQANSKYATVLAGGGARPATAAEVRAVLEGYGAPEIVVYDRRTSGGLVVPDDRILLLPARGETELGATFWGQTLTASDPTYQIADSEMPGLVTGVYRNPKPPMIAEVTGDAIGLPVLANANLSLAAKVL